VNAHLEFTCTTTIDGADYAELYESSTRIEHLDVSITRHILPHGQVIAIQSPIHDRYVIFPGSDFDNRYPVMPG
jgi:hypothetical protein